MAILTYGDLSYEVDHAVKGADFIHAYDANAVMIVAFDGIVDFSGFTYDGTYMEPEHCLAEGCNDVKYVEGALKKADGTPLSPADIGVTAPAKFASIMLSAAAWTGDETYTQVVSIDGVTPQSKVDLQPNAATLTAMIEDGVSALYVANDNGVLTAYALGAAPTVDMAIQATVTEMDASALDTPEIETTEVAE